ncbi:MAG: hypothetical protein COT00_05505 [Candidatus Omnitrophica bacterium CG07_land_8_20_14_0_80_50_8]|nr:MAG: hypothetical protein COT00_05505 [Candidatus Omnitrophica bacterium CG07_land_8_20_14_0_80_50_8]
MDYEAIKKLGNKLYFTVQDMALVMGITTASAHVACSRYVKKGLFLRIKNNFYVLDQNWERFSELERLQIANYLQVPSYVSFMTALVYYEVTTQVARGFVECACLKRSVSFDAKESKFNYIKIKRDYYSGFLKKNGIFIASPEKAFIDSVYLTSFGKYALDTDALDMRKLNINVVKKIARVFPKKTRELADKLCRT